MSKKRNRIHHCPAPRPTSQPSDNVEGDSRVAVPFLLQLFDVERNLRHKLGSFTCEQQPAQSPSLTAKNLRVSSDHALPLSLISRPSSQISKIFQMANASADILPFNVQSRSLCKLNILPQDAESRIGSVHFTVI